jgi:hypothetical protein
MTTPHKATPEQWAQLRACAAIYPGAWGDCILELRDRIALLEATQHAHADASRMSDAERERFYAELAKPARVELLEAAANSSAGLTGSPAPAGGLVERVADAMDGGTESQARAAIPVVAEWLVEQSPEPGPVGKLLGQISTPFAVMADMLRDEVQRNA